jgi:hypothetical protein
MGDNGATSTRLIMEIKSGEQRAPSTIKAQAWSVGVPQRGNKYLLGGDNEWPGYFGMMVEA